MTEWQPIETAPKDGTKVLLFVDGEVISGGWDKLGGDCGDMYIPGWAVVALNSHGCGCCSSANGYPTHWMPLPQPPEQDQ